MASAIETPTPNALIKAAKHQNGSAHSGSRRDFGPPGFATMTKTRNTRKKKIPKDAVGMPAHIERLLQRLGETPSDLIEIRAGRIRTDGYSTCLSHCRLGQEEQAKRADRVCEQLAAGAIHGRINNLIK
jgi:hypothetical protein